MVSQCPDTHSRRAFVLTAAACMAFAGPGQASTTTILTVIRPDRTRRTYDDAAFARFDWHDVITHTVWTEGPQHFQGPLLKDVLNDAGFSDFDLPQRTLTLSALNDFVLEIPASDAILYAPLLARVANGARMTVRDKGPLWLVYPRDTTPELQAPLFDERWVWQLTRIEIR